MPFLFLLISFLASIIGSICGIGGGILIKPVLDMVGAASVSTISFLSSCTVLSMSLYNVGRSLKSSQQEIDLSVATPLAIGAALGGLLGGLLFQTLREVFGRDNILGAVQSLCLLLLVLGTLLYSLNKSRIQPIRLRRKDACAAIGLALGFLSSFLGIGGGPFNLVVLHYFLGQETKKAAANSLYIILVSQAANLLLLLVRDAVPPFDVLILLLMVSGGILGGIAGRRISEKINDETVDVLFRVLLYLIIGICFYNIFRYLSL